MTPPVNSFKAADPTIKGILEDGIENAKEIAGLVYPDGSFSADQKDLIALNKVLKPQNRLQAREFGTLAAFLLLKQEQKAQPAPDLSVEQISSRKYRVIWTTDNTYQGTFEIPEHVGQGRAFNSVKVANDQNETLYLGAEFYLVIEYTTEEGNSRLLLARPSDDHLWNSTAYEIKDDRITYISQSYTDENLQTMIDGILPKSTPKKVFTRFQIPE